MPITSTNTLGDRILRAIRHAYWTAAYSGDVNNLPSNEACGTAGETSVVGRQATALTTRATSATVGIGIHDTATLSRATDAATGTITFSLYRPNDATCSGTPVSHRIRSRSAVTATMCPAPSPRR